MSSYISGPRTLPWRFQAGWYAVHKRLPIPDFRVSPSTESPSSRTQQWSVPRRGALVRRSRPVGCRDRELAPSADARNESTSRRWRASPQSRSAARIGSDPRRDRGPAVGQLLGQPRPAREDVIDRQRQLVASRPGDLGLEEEAARRPVDAAGRVRRRGRRRRAPRSRAGRPAAPLSPVRSSRTAGMVDSSPAIRASAVGVRRPDQPSLGRVARAASRLFAPEDRVDHVARHDPVGRVLAATDPDDTVRLDRDAVLARRLDGRPARRRDERPQPGVRADHVGPRQVHVHRRVDRVEQAVHLPAGCRRSLGWAVERARPWCRSASSRATGRGRRSCPGPGS